MSTDDGNLNKLARKNRLLGPRPDDEEPPEVTIRRGRGDSDAELYDYMRKLWAEQKAENARLKAELDALKARRCETCERAYVALGRLCCDAVTPDGEWVESDHYCGYYKLKETADA